MDPSSSKRTLFTVWLRHGNVRVYFDSGHPGVAIPERYGEDLEMWVVFNAARVTELTVDGRVGSELVSIPWDSVHGMESLSLEEAHVWSKCFERLATRGKGPVLS